MSCQLRADTFDNINDLLATASMLDNDIAEDINKIAHKQCQLSNVLSRVVAPFPR